MKYLILFLYYFCAITSISLICHGHWFATYYAAIVIAHGMSLIYFGIEE